MMTFSICVREHYENDDGESHRRFGVAVTTRIPGVGTLCPFVSENGAVATQSLVNVDLGRDGIRYVDDGLGVEDALEALLNADDGASQRQLHGVDADGAFVFSGEDCGDWFGHHEHDHFTVAGNLLVSESVLEATADTYAECAVHETGDPWTGPRSVSEAAETEPLAKRLIDALAAGHLEGGDKREHLPVQSAALVVTTTEEFAVDPPYNDLRIDATETPIADLRRTYDLALEGYADTLALYEEAYEEDSLEDADEPE
ncbi:N-terminal nucleophile hydrolase superfamily protein [Natrarchaeobaculum sulfurireducens]|uniref:N-terminal nucleophile hydrolase superfamily protein n=2 Tax=Natrarchaeobaculum sulfurireducens TaxID=2044521 RepID=A0A346PC35_9EURY|nr:N-terminal nucleophile hydrolase superfamily protein [Natrarchaeobaculum sulfurireducens]